jgi:hypothetical protein
VSVTKSVITIIGIPLLTGVTGVNEIGIVTPSPLLPSGAEEKAVNFGKKMK